MKGYQGFGEKELETLLNWLRVSIWDDDKVLEMDSDH